MHGHAKPASFHSSPQEAMTAPAEEFLYVACLREGTGVDAPDFLAVVDAEAGSIVHEMPLPNVGDELHPTAGIAARPRATGPTART